jgi:ubiquitin-protein ligase
MRKSPRQRRLEADYRAIVRLRDQSSIFDFEARGNPPESYRFLFHGLGVWKMGTEVVLRDRHVVVVELAAAYPRLMPNLAWQTPIFHPNISSSGVVCLGGYGTHWVPSLTLDELCVMLWDMIRYANFDPNSPYNREAALWARLQEDLTLPLDPRPLRNHLVPQGDGVARPAEAHHAVPPVVRPPDTQRGIAPWAAGEPEIVLAEIVQAAGPPEAEIIFLN